MRSALTEELHLRVRATGDELGEIRRIFLGEHARRQNLAVDFGAQVLVRLFGHERRAFAVFLKRLEDGRGVVGEVHDHHIFLAFVAAVQPRHRLHGVAIHDGLVEEHAGEQGLVEAGLEFVRHDHQAVVVALEPLLDQLARLQFIDGVLADFLVGFRVR